MIDKQENPECVIIRQNSRFSDFVKSAVLLLFDLITVNCYLA